MKRLIIFLMFFSILVPAVLTSCKSKSQMMERPENLVNRITLVNILAESYLIESSLHYVNIDSIPRDELARRYYRDLFNRYHITEEQFEKSVAYYVSNEKTAEKLLTDASAIIVNKRSEFNFGDLPQEVQ